MRAVLDANVLVSALIRPVGPPGEIVEAFVRDRRFDLVVSPATLNELRRVLGYPRLRRSVGLSALEIDAWVGALGVLATVVEGPVLHPVVVADPGDDIYIAAAVDGLAEFIVSGDRHLLDLREHEGIRILTPREFLSVLERGGRDSG